MEAQQVVGTDWTPLLIAVLSGAVGGALVSGLFALWRSEVDARRANRGWLREKRVEAYAEFHSATSRLFLEAAMGRDFGEDWSSLDVLNQAKGRISLLGPPDVDATAIGVYDLVYELVNHAQSDEEEMETPEWESTGERLRRDVGEGLLDFQDIAQKALKLS